MFRFSTLTLIAFLSLFANINFAQTPTSSGAKQRLNLRRRVAATSTAPTKIAFTCLDADNQKSVCTVNEDGTSLAYLASGQHPIWSPDGNKIAFTRETANAHGTQSFVYLMNADGSDVRFVAEGESPAFAPDGSRLAFTHGTGIYTADTYGNDARIVFFNTDGAKLNLTWTANNFLYSDGKQVFSVRADGSHLRPLTSARPASCVNPRPSPDGTQFVAQCAGSSGTELYLGSTDGSTPLRRLTRATEGDRAPVWSPDGKQIIFYRQADANQLDLLVFNLTTDALTRLTATSGSSESFASWSTDNTKIAYFSQTVDYRSAQPSGIYIANPDGTNARFLIANASAQILPCAPQWQPRRTARATR